MLECISPMNIRISILPNVSLKSLFTVTNPVSDPKHLMIVVNKSGKPNAIV